MIKTTLKRIFAIVGSALAPLAAVLYLIAGIEAVISIAHDVTTNFFLMFAFFLLFGVAIGLIFYGAKVLFSFLNKEDNAEPFNVLVLCFTVFQFVLNLLIICFFGGNAANWIILIFSLAASLTLLIHVCGIRTAWYTDVIGVAIGMVTALTAACSSAGLMLAASIIVAIICFLIMASFALYLIKDTDKENSDEDKK